MMGDKIMEAINGIRDEYVESAGKFLGQIEPESGAGRPGGRRRGWVKIVLIAAVIASLLSLPAYALTEYLLNSPEQAQKQALEEVDRLNELGIIQVNLEPDQEATKIFKTQGQELGLDFFHRIIYPNYHVQLFDGKYKFVTQLDMASGKLQFISITAKADEEDRVYQEENSLPDGSSQTLTRYDNTDDLVSPELTVGELCAALAEYWGFEGYTLSGTENTDYGWDTEAPAEDSLVKDILDGPYITVYFDGDQEGVPMYVELYTVSGATVMSIGTNHLVG
ncbi:MAG TPA: hypothetical protein IAC00_07015 [Candidatus Limivicinus faecipullorum]|nr:hypothetical protein [Candidatus Limivicinus faecipullorum]